MRHPCEEVTRRATADFICVAQGRAATVQMEPQNRRSWIRSGYDDLSGMSAYMQMKVGGQVLARVYANRW